ncbi:hypothetical protein FE633_10075 [Streptomyces montanus]|uniref:Uncharacterized protein n=1 Tax=Streptomyces montanus TaxID=2580423 RepID=A0A5R9FWI9_9ACTN|nr:hypothetical protein [Streptomyces montanus]TLS46280.1 hypothetical protein FE633_10075 [Streptomyces montanus]
MAEDSGPGLIRVVYFERISALMMVAGVVLSEGALLLLTGTAPLRETLMVVTAAITLVSLLLLPLWFRLPARVRREYEDAVQIAHIVEPYEGEDAARRLSLRRAAVLVGVPACWMVLIGLTFHELMPPVMLVPVAVAQWARSRATAGWERANGAALWLGVPRPLRRRGPVLRSPAAGGM